MTFDTCELKGLAKGLVEAFELHDVAGDGGDVGAVISWHRLTPLVLSVGTEFEMSCVTGGIAEHRGDVEACKSGIGDLRDRKAEYGGMRFVILKTVIEQESCDEPENDEDFEFSFRFRLKLKVV